MQGATHRLLSDSRNGIAREDSGRRTENLNDRKEEEEVQPRTIWDDALGEVVSKALGPRTSDALRHVEGSSSVSPIEPALKLHAPLARRPIDVRLGQAPQWPPPPAAAVLPPRQIGKASRQFEPSSMGGSVSLDEALNVEAIMNAKVDLHLLSYLDPILPARHYTSNHTIAIQAHDEAPSMSKKASSKRAVLPEDFTSQVARPSKKRRSGGRSGAARIPDPVEPPKTAKEAALLYS